MQKEKGYMVNERKKKANAIVSKLQKLFPDEERTMLEYRTNFELLVAVELSAQCTDARVNLVTKALFKKYKTLSDYAEADPREFEQDIHSTGFYKNKTKNILAAAKMVRDVYGGKIPKSMEEMLLIPGVARKTANVVLGNAYGIVVGIAVDTHVTRLARLWGLTTESNPVKIERDLMTLIPKAEWYYFTYRVIEYGRTYCPARKKDHSDCPLARFETN